MNKKAICSIVLIAVAVLGFMVWGYASMAGPTQAELNQPSSFTAMDMLYDFGTISMANGKVDHVFQVSNPTDQPIMINNVQTSCMCTGAYLVNGADRQGPYGMPGMGGITSANTIVPAHGTQSVDVVFDPAAHGPAGVGDIDRTIDVSQANGGTIQFEIKAVVTP